MTGSDLGIGLQWWLVCSSRPIGVILVSGFWTFGIVLRTTRGEEEMYKMSSIQWHIKKRLSKLWLCWLCEHCSISWTVTGFIPHNANDIYCDSFQMIFQWYYYSWAWSFLCPQLLPWTFIVLKWIPNYLASDPIAYHITAIFNSFSSRGNMPRNIT
jgi:hypothetical protein